MTSRLDNSRSGAPGMAMVILGNQIVARSTKAGEFIWISPEDGDYLLSMVAGGGGASDAEPGFPGGYHEEKVSLRRGDRVAFRIGAGGIGGRGGLPGVAGQDTTFTIIRNDTAET